MRFFPLAGFYDGPNDASDNQCDTNDTDAGDKDEGC